MDVVLELVFTFLEFFGLRKIKKKVEKPTSFVADNSTPEQDMLKDVVQGDTSGCAGCNRPLDTGAVYELDKRWCADCYKTKVLKIKS